MVRGKTWESLKVKGLWSEDRNLTPRRQGTFSYTPLPWNVSTTILTQPWNSHWTGNFYSAPKHISYSPDNSPCGVLSSHVSLNTGPKWRLGISMPRQRGHFCLPPGSCSKASVKLIVNHLCCFLDIEHDHLTYLMRFWHLQSVQQALDNHYLKHFTESTPG